MRGTGNTRCIEYSLEHSLDDPALVSCLKINYKDINFIFDFPFY